MKNRIGLIILVLACVGLLVGLITVNKQANDRAKKDVDTILNYSNQVVTADVKRRELEQVNAVFESDLAKERQTSTQFSNKVLEVSATLTETTGTLAKTQSDLKQAQADLADRDAKINSLEAQNQQLDKQALDLSTAITNLTTQIADTQKKLTASEGDKAFLEKELKRLMAEKAELERQFNDLAVMRAQVAKLKEELNIARRIEWIRQGLFANADQKGAQKLMQGVSAPVTSTKAVKPAYDLNVEINSDGSVKVLPPRTNAPAAIPAAGK